MRRCRYCGQAKAHPQHVLTAAAAAAAAVTAAAAAVTAAAAAAVTAAVTAAAAVAVEGLSGQPPGEGAPSLTISSA